MTSPMGKARLHFDWCSRPNHEADTADTYFSHLFAFEILRFWRLAVGLAFFLKCLFCWIKLDPRIFTWPRSPPDDLGWFLGMAQAKWSWSDEPRISAFELYHSMHSMHSMRHVSLRNAFPIFRVLLLSLLAPASGLRTVADEAPGERPEGASVGMSKAGFTWFNQFVIIMF